jgi:hypothetical protein
MVKENGRRILCIGPGRSASTFFDYLLRNNFSNTLKVPTHHKELNYLISNEVISTFKQQVDYLSFFDNLKPGEGTIEFSPGYINPNFIVENTNFGQVIERAELLFNSSAEYLILLRDPFSRMKSQYTFDMRSYGASNHLIGSLPISFGPSKDLQYYSFPYSIELAFISNQLEWLYKHVPRSRIKIFLYDEIFNGKHSELFEFLDIDLKKPLNLGLKINSTPPLSIHTLNSQNNELVPIEEFAILEKNVPLLIKSGVAAWERPFTLPDYQLKTFVKIFFESKSFFATKDTPILSVSARHGNRNFFYNEIKKITAITAMNPDWF